jgi:hypothetical protein
MVVHEPSRYASDRLTRLCHPFLERCAQRADRLWLLEPHLRLPESLSGRPHAWLSPHGVVEQPHDCAGTRFVLDGSPDECEAMLGAFARLGRTHPELLGQCEITVLQRPPSHGAGHAASLCDRVLRREPGEKELAAILARSCYALVAIPADRGYGSERPTRLVGLALAFGVPLLLPEHYAPSWQAENVLRYASNDPVEALCLLIGKSHEQVSDAARRLQGELLAREQSFADAVLAETS